MNHIQTYESTTRCIQLACTERKLTLETNGERSRRGPVLNYTQPPARAHAAAVEEHVGSFSRCAAAATNRDFKANNAINIALRRKIKITCSRPAPASAPAHTYLIISIYIVWINFSWVRCFHSRPVDGSAKSSCTFKHVWPPRAPHLYPCQVRVT